MCASLNVVCILMFRQGYPHGMIAALTHLTCTCDHSLRTRPRPSSTAHRRLQHLSSRRNRIRNGLARYARTSTLPRQLRAKCARRLVDLFPFRFADFVLSVNVLRYNYITIYRKQIWAWHVGRERMQVLRSQIIDIVYRSEKTQATARGCG